MAYLVPRSSLLLIASLGIALAGCGDGDGGGITEPPTGTLEITTATTGPGPATYTLLMDGVSLGPIGASTTRPLAEVAAGAHSVGLSDLPANCQLQGENPREVTLSGGATVNVDFAITCTTPPAQTGTLAIGTSTTGVNPDPDGYQVIIDRGAPQSIAVTGSISVVNVAAGDHTVQLSGLASNCTVSSANPQNVSLAPGATVSVSFAVTCGASSTGSLSIVTATTGSNPDPDGYAFTVDDQPAQPIGSAATVEVASLPAGPHTVALSGVAPNCAVAGENPRSVEVQAGTSTTVSFAISCTAPSSSTPIAFGSVAVGLRAIFVVNPDGSGLRNLTPAGETEYGPVWSPDGAKILFGKDDDLFVMNADGTGRVQLADTESPVQYRWSPDGRMIAFVDILRVGGDFFPELWVMQSDGGGKLKLADGGTSPSWSPDGRLAYESGQAIHIVNADGTGGRQLTAPGTPAFQPAWSPDGARIAFVTLGDKEMFLINPDGTGLVNLTQGVADDDTPAWSPDGSKIVFTTSPRGPSLNSDIAVMNRDGSGRTTLTTTPWFDITPAWSPDGQRVVFVSGENDSEIFVMNADGTGQVNISNRPDTEDTEPDWSRGQGAAANAALRAGALKNRDLTECRRCMP
jgi:Tol biopolymer transport system component